MYIVKGASAIYGHKLYYVYELLGSLLREAKDNGTRGDRLIEFAGGMWQEYEPRNEPIVGKLIAATVLRAAELLKVLSS